MKRPLRLGVVGVGRIGRFHARHARELERETGSCRLVAIADAYGNAAKDVARLLSEQGEPVLDFRSAEALIRADVIDAAVVASATRDHDRHCRILVEAGYRVMLEKPLAFSVEAASDLCRFLSGDDRKQRAVMQAFMRRFDEPLVQVKQLIAQGRIGRPFKIVSILEDPEPPPTGYESAGILADMAVHNIDEVAWLRGDRPVSVRAIGSTLYSQNVTPVEEDFDDAFLHLWFPGGAAAQIQVSRNHVAGYRNETWVFGEEGLIHVGGFQERPLVVQLEIFNREGSVERSAFEMRDYGASVPVFIERFGPAYRRELGYFVAQCLRDEPFSVDQENGLSAMKVADAGRRSALTRETAHIVK